MRAAWILGAAALVAAGSGCGRGDDTVSPTEPIQSTPTPTDPPASAPPVTPTGTATATGTPAATGTASPTPTATSTQPPTAPPTPTATIAPPTAPPDSDEDGWADGDDCAPLDPAINPGAAEVCDAAGAPADEDCDGAVDEGLDADGDGVINCLDPEVCDGADDDGDGIVDEDTADLDGDLLCDERDDDRDGDRVLNDADPAPDDGAINTDPTGLFHMPGPGELLLFAPAAADARVWLDAGEGPAEIEGSPLSLGAAETWSLGLGEGAVRIEATAPVIGFFMDSSSSGDRLLNAVGADGAYTGTTLYVWAADAVTVVADEGAPGSVSISRHDGEAGWSPLGALSVSGGRGHTFILTQPGLHRVRSSTGTITAYGWDLDGAFSGMAMVAGDGALGSAALRFQRPATAPAVQLAVMATEPSTTVEVRRGDLPMDGLSLSEAGDVGWISAATDSAYTLSAASPLVAWVEPQLGASDTDTTLRDVVLAPGISGAVVDTDFLIPAVAAADDQLPETRGDLWVMAFDDDTAVDAWILDGEDWVPQPQEVLARGASLLVVRDLGAQGAVRIEASQPVTVTHGHDQAQFGATVWAGRAFTSHVRGDGQSCDPAGQLDHCAVGLSCVERVCAGDDAAPTETPTPTPPQSTPTEAGTGGASTPTPL